MPNIAITDLPAAGTIDGTELVPIVQNGVTVRTTTAAVAGSPSQQQTHWWTLTWRGSGRGRGSWRGS